MNFQHNNLSCGYKTAEQKNATRGSSSMTFDELGSPVSKKFDDMSNASRSWTAFLLHSLPDFHANGFNLFDSLQRIWIPNFRNFFATMPPRVSAESSNFLMIQYLKFQFFQYDNMCTKC